MAAVKQIVEKAISENAVAVFSKSYCPYCKATKETLSQFIKNYYLIELDQEENGADIQNYLREKTGQNSVPNIFIKQEHIGGNSDLAALNKAGKLKSMLA
ncbi:Glutaredoxin-1 [Taphrina deformans PYCC 5710]|uniref:Glutaredoxin-1 n=1 Tax=Taphrina deformans (strain PYCC 5710 / ATCC 11124 / CBS 356.35 / IMI 108563 / JCM 9778 / NBRC 8474) TaxID=1097556 RepID=R4XD89_TAPDE|nr:Glutaredoxin-1 [Taphrina deformans PYCC 5710]|eukprot:CCG81293.1 Glutaredoxin-1 [Taphrina deformans PYCC 5710]